MKKYFLIIVFLFAFKCAYSQYDFLEIRIDIFKSSEGKIPSHLTIKIYSTYIWGDSSFSPDKYTFQNKFCGNIRIDNVSKDTLIKLFVNKNEFNEIGDLISRGLKR